MKNYVRLLPLLGLMLAGCAQSAETEMVEPTETAAVPAPTNLLAPAPAVGPTETASPAPEVPLARLWRTAGHPVIYQGTMELEVDDFTTASARLDTVLIQRGAYLTNALETTDTGRHQQVLTIRVPSAQFLALTSALTRLGTVHHKQLTSRDVAAELARQAAKPGARPDTAATRQAATEHQLLTEQAALATLQLTYFQFRPATDLVPPEAAVAPRIRAGLWFGWRIVGQLFIALAYVWPLLLGVAGWGFWHWRRTSTAVGQ
ncbi:hypothetical protein CDA63_09750 [Hymenobacter amundsenii]|uniref:DUF4349 domain-containing protein n=1 Tax=Hymenobacter amundsenii TaxID=2006685 RepID=A0A2D0AFV7_9BACT|nr:DUF4349 domain-containing protein [Hymenobacter amundsenii]OWP63300.1 hypothetical protein CDA63_09750 [Hymenobacter amundsenii]